MQASDLSPGTRLGPYRIEGRLGQGGMGIVYLGQHVSLSRMVAIKVLASTLAEDPDFRRRFERESKLAASLEHPHIVPVYDAGEAQGLLYIAMRFIEGIDLAKLLQAEGRLVPDRVLSVMGQTADALDEAHTAGLIHRDVKPGNIMLAPSRRGTDEHVYLTDFGLARASAAATRLTRSGYFVGTIHYSSPEQFTGSDVDGRTDVYSLGCVAFECLTGKVPFDRPHEPAVMYAHLQEAPPRVTEELPELPAAVDDVVATALAKRPEDRFATCGEMVSALRQALAGQRLPTTRAGPGTRPTGPGVVATPPTTPAIAGPGPGTVTETFTPPGPQPSPPRRGRWPWIAAGAIVVTVTLFAGGVLLLSSGDRMAVTSQPEVTPSAATTPPASPSPPPPETPQVAEGRFEGETRQGELVTFTVKRSMVQGVHFEIELSGCFSSEGLGELIGQEFDWGPLDESIDPEGRFKFRERSVEGTQMFDGRFSQPEQASGTVSVRVTEGVTSPCVTGKIPWSATLAA